jgi:hypothetical protein
MGVLRMLLNGLFHHFAGIVWFSNLNMQRLNENYL